MECPKCGGPTWSNAEKKAKGEMKPTAPDFKCKDQTCGWVKWPPKDGQAPRRPTSTGPVASYTWDDLGRTYKRCHEIASRVLGSVRDDASVVAATATLFIQATKLGLKDTRDADV